MLISSLNMCFTSAVLSIVALQADAACSVTVNGIPATPEKHFGVPDGSIYLFQTVYEFNKVLDINFINKFDSWKEESPQKFQLQNNSAVMKSCRKNESCTITYNYTEPSSLFMLNRFTSHWECLIVVSEAREICRLNLIIGSKKENIDFDLSWVNRSSAYEMDIALKKGFPGPFNYFTSCENTPVTNLSNGAVLILTNDLDVTGIKKCSVTVSSRFEVNSLKKEIPVPSRPYFTNQYFYPSSTQSTSHFVKPWRDSTVAAACIIVILMIAFIAAIIFLRKNMCCQQNVTLNNHVVTESAEKPPDVIQRHSPSVDEDYVSSLTEDSELETDGPSQRRKRTQSTSSSISISTSAVAAIAMFPLHSETQTGNGDTPQESCSILVHPVEESQGVSKPGQLDELAHVGSDGSAIV